MRVLVLCVDRDNDLGEKAGIRGPVVGREANLQAATQLALEDPEESDANSIFGAVKVHDELVAAGEDDVHVATITGDRKVGTYSDRRIARHLDDVVARIRPDRCIFVTDGAEDEFVLPLVASRVPVEAVRRIIVKQNADLEGTYYVIKKALEDDKLQKTFLLPFALASLLYGAFAFLGYPDKGLGAIFIAVGAVFLAKILHLGDAVRRTVNDVYSGLTAGKITLVTSLLAILILLVGMVAAGRALLDEPPGTPIHFLALDTAERMIWWLIASALTGVTGKVVDAYVRQNSVLWGYWSFPFSLIAAGLILTAAVGFTRNIVRGVSWPFTWTEIAPLATGLLLAFVGTVTAARVRERFDRTDPSDDGGSTENAPVDAPHPQG